jgi:hypothetical protein
MFFVVILPSIAALILTAAQGNKCPLLGNLYLVKVMEVATLILIRAGMSTRNCVARELLPANANMPAGSDIRFLASEIN